MASSMLNPPRARVTRQEREFANTSDTELWKMLTSFLDKWQASTERACAAAEKGLESEAGAARSHFEDIVDQTCDRAFEISARDCIRELKRRHVSLPHQPATVSNLLAH